MTAPPPWVAQTPRADPDVSFGPTVYADDPPGVVAFLTDPPWHRAADGGCYVPDPICARCGVESNHHDDNGCEWVDAEDWPLVKPCTWCSGSGVYSDEVQSCECPWCHGDGEARDE